MQERTVGQRSRGWEVLIAVAALIIAGVALSLIVEKTETGVLCTICGARGRKLALDIKHLTFWRRESIANSPITRLRSQLIGRCAHDWELDWGSSGSLFGWRGHGDAFASRDYPIGRIKLAQGLQRFEDKAATIQALKAIGDENNKLRFLAADAAISLAYMNQEERKQFNWQSWWASHREAFTICRDSTSALAIARKYLEADEGLMAMGAEETFSKLGAWPPDSDAATK